MSGTIRDGSGKANLAKVNDNQRLYTSSITSAESVAANRIGNAYNINTGVITLGTANDTPVMYVKNQEEQDLIITAIAIGLGTSTNGVATKEVKITVVRGPTAGTTISNANAVDINSNRNYGSANTLDVLAYKGADGETLTGGVDHLLFFQPDFGRLFATIDEVLPKGTAIGVKVTPPTSNTSLDMYAAIICHLADERE
jgi:hypothetical protein